MTKSDAWLQSEFDLLTEACLRLKTHPTLTALQDLPHLGDQHAAMLLHYADQLDGLLTTIDRHAGTLQRMAKDDQRAAEFCRAARNAVADVESTLRPLIRTLRIKAVDASPPPSSAVTGNNFVSSSHPPCAKGEAAQSWSRSDDDLSPERVLH